MIRYNKKELSFIRISFRLVLRESREGEKVKLFAAFSPGKCHVTFSSRRHRCGCFLFPVYAMIRFASIINKSENLSGNIFSRACFLITMGKQQARLHLEAQS